MRNCGEVYIAVFGDVCDESNSYLQTRWIGPSWRFVNRFTCGWHLAANLLAILGGYMYSAQIDFAERCPSGLRSRFRKPVCSLEYRGFESRPLRLAGKAGCKLLRAVNLQQYPLPVFFHVFSTDKPISFTNKFKSDGKNLSCFRLKQPAKT